MRRDVKLSGFVANVVKSQWTPAQRGELLSFVLDLSAGIFQVPQRKVDSFCLLLEIIVSKGFVASARQLSRFKGLSVYMGLALGPVVWLWMGSLYSDILKCLGTVHSTCQMMLCAKFSSGAIILTTVFT